MQKRNEGYICVGAETDLVTGVPVDVLCYAARSEPYSNTVPCGKEGRLFVARSEDVVPVGCSSCIHETDGTVSCCTFHRGFPTPSYLNVNCSETGRCGKNYANFSPKKPEPTTPTVESVAGERKLKLQAMIEELRGMDETSKEVDFLFLQLVGAFSSTATLFIDSLNGCTFVDDKRKKIHGVTWSINHALYYMPSEYRIMLMQMISEGQWMVGWCKVGSNWEFVTHPNSLAMAICIAVLAAHIDLIDGEEEQK
jgi:hypothetical protein